MLTVQQKFVALFRGLAYLIYKNSEVKELNL